MVSFDGLGPSINDYPLDLGAVVNKIFAPDQDEHAARLNATVYFGA
jgi:hypothetical protein